MDSLQLCSEDCNARADCKSFEWGPTSKVCSLNRAASPSAGRFQDYIFCSRLGGGQSQSSDPVAATLFQKRQSSAVREDAAERANGTTGREQVMSKEKLAADRKREALLHKKAEDTARQKAVKAAREKAREDKIRKKEDEVRKKAEEKERQRQEEDRKVQLAREAARRQQEEVRKAAELEAQKQEELRKKLAQWPPGKYRIVLDDVPVSATADRSRKNVAHLAAGTLVTVEEVSQTLVEGRVRARLADPAGWVSLFHPGSQIRFAERVA